MDKPTDIWSYIVVLLLISWIKIDEYVYQIIYANLILGFIFVSELKIPILHLFKEMWIKLVKQGRNAKFQQNFLKQLVKDLMKGH